MILSEQERQELIGWLKGDLSVSHQRSVELRSISEQIALASLTAERAGIVRSNDYIDEDSRGTHSWVEWEKGGFPIKSTLIYTAPPVQVMKPIDIGESTVMSRGFVIKAIRDAGYEVVDLTTYK